MNTSCDPAELEHLWGKVVLIEVREAAQADWPAMTHDDWHAVLRHLAEQQVSPHDFADALHVEMTSRFGPRAEHPASPARRKPAVEPPFPDRR